MSQVEFDAEVAARIESLYQIGDAVRRRRIVRETLGASPGERILDVGCGPGFYCVELAEEVGPSGSVVGVDSSPAMLELAARRCAGHDNVELRPGEAVSLPGRRRQFRRCAVCAGARVRCRPDGGVGRDAPSAATRRSGPRLGRRLGNRLAAHCRHRAQRTGAASVGSASDPPFVATNTCAADALGRLRTGSHASASVHHVRVRPGDIRRCDAPLHRQLRRRTATTSPTTKPSGGSASNNSSARAASTTSPAPSSASRPPNPDRRPPSDERHGHACRAVRSRPRTSRPRRPRTHRSRRPS